ncbi:MAG: alpha-amylase, partial [Prevotella sp.]|nr:alpha-amylase [Prevotella sp.]
NVWKWTYTGTLTTLPTNIIFNGSFGQTSDLDFKNGGYYNEAGALQGTVTGIQLPTATTGGNRLLKVYTIDGHLLRILPSDTTEAEALNQLKHGIYVINGKKIVK